MPIFKVERLDEGLNELSNPENIKGLQQSVNYEILGDGFLHKRTDPEEYGNYVSGDSLKTVLAEIFSNSIQQVSPPYYPVHKLSDMVGDFIILVFGLVAEGYKLYMFYEDSTTWVAEEVTISKIEYDVDTYLEFSVGDDSIIITDTGENAKNNLPHYFSVDSEGEVSTGDFGVPPPIGKPTVDILTEYNSEEFEEVEGNNRLGDCGIFQCLYTVVTEEGEESNPSPISNSRVMQFFQKDEVDFSDERWIKKVTVKNLSIPDIAGDVLARLKYFNIYFRIIRYSAGEGSDDFYFSQRFSIFDKDNIGGTTGNAYTLLVEIDPSLAVSYEKDIAPIAKHSAETSGIVGLGNVKEKFRLQFDFDYYVPITIKNINSKNYVDAIIKMGLMDGTESSDDKIENLDWGDFSIGGGVIGRTKYIRIYDTDLITPIKVGYEDYDGSSRLVVYLKIPLLVAGQDKIVYLCWNKASSIKKGVNIVNFQNIDNGQFFQIEEGSNYEEIFESERVLSIDSEITSPMDIPLKTTECINRADNNRNGVFSGTVAWVKERIAKRLSTGELIGQENSVRLGLEQTLTKNVVEYDLTFDVMPTPITIWGRIKYNSYDMSSSLEDVPYQAIWQFYKTSPKLSICGAFNTRSTQWAFLVGEKSMTFENIGHTPVNVNSANDNQIGDYFYLISIDKGNKVSLFIGDNDDNTLYYEEKDWDEFFDEEPEEDELSEIEKFTLGGRGRLVTFVTDKNFSIPGAYYDQWQVLRNQYYSAESEDDINAVKYIADFMPDYDAPIGLII